MTLAAAAGSMLLYLVIATQLLYGCSIGIQPVQSQEQVWITRHFLPQNRLESVYGSKMNASCTEFFTNSDNICSGTSVLNDSIIPAVDTSRPAWASQLFTLSGTRGIIRLSFEVNSSNHDRMELAVFNCPEMGIGLSSIRVYFDQSFRPGRDNTTLGTLIVEPQLMATSCDQLLVFCVKYDTTQSPTRFINLEILNNTSEDYVFFGEVTFLNGGNEPCNLAIGGTETTSSQGTDGGNPTLESSNNTVTIIAIVVVLLVSIVIGAIIIVLVVIVCLKTRKRKHDSDKVHKLQSVVLETKEDEEKEAESYMGNEYDVISDKQPRNGVKTAANGDTTMDAVYSNPDEAITDDSYSHLHRGSQKKTVPSQKDLMVATDNEYSKLNRERSQTDPIVHNLPAQQNPTDVYAIPDMKKKKASKKSSSKAPTIPEKSSELVEYLDSKEADIAVNNGSEIPQYSEIDGGHNRLNSSVGPVPLSSSVSHTFVSNLDSNPIYHSTDIVPPQSHNGAFATDAIYSEPLPPNEQEPEWDPDQNIYEAIYSEALQPSLFMQEREEIESEDLRPYTSIYAAPIVPTTDKPLSISYGNIKEVRSLGNGNFGDVVLAQTVGLTPGQLRLEGNAPHTLVAVKKLKANASERNRELFEKEVRFMSRLDHPNVIRLLGVCTDEAAPFIMMEYMTNGDLNQYLQGFSMQSTEHEVYSNVNPIETPTLIRMCTQIASAMQYLATQNFIHRDLATRNCLVGPKDTIKVSDFGMSRSLYESQYYVINGHAILPIRWMATECFYGKFSAKTDVWAFGVTMWEIFMLGKEQPYAQLQDREVVEDAIKGPDRMLLEQPSICPKDVYEIMKKCWIYDASQRSTFDELFSLLPKMNQ